MASVGLKIPRAMIPRLITPKGLSAYHETRGSVGKVQHACYCGVHEWPIVLLLSEAQWPVNAIPAGRSAVCQLPTWGNRLRAVRWTRNAGENSALLLTRRQGAIPTHRKCTTHIARNTTCHP